MNKFFRKQPQEDYKEKFPSKWEISKECLWVRLEVLVRLCWQREKTFLKAKKPVGEAEKGKVWDIDEKKKKKKKTASSSVGMGHSNKKKITGNKFGKTEDSDLLWV